MTERATPDGLAARAGSLMRTGWRQLVHRWRASLGFRVVAVTMLLGILVLTAVGTYLYGSIAQGLVDSRQKIAADDSLVLRSQAQRTFDANDKAASEIELTQVARDLLRGFTQNALTERRYAVITRSDNNDSQLVIGPIETTTIGSRFIPTELRHAVSTEPDRQHIQVATIQDEGGVEVPAVIVGQSIEISPIGQYGLYVIYPMEREREIISLVGQAFLIGGAALIVLVGAIAFVVTRLVADPVRRAARVAERFAEGHLNERMRAKGEDDLARLGNSFNAMAASLQQQIAQLENLSRVQQRFVSDVSHELRTPLTTIRMAGELIHDARTGFEPTVSRSAELLMGELDRFESLLSDLLEISRFDAGAASLEVEATDLRACVDRVVGSLETLAASKGSRVIVRESPEPVIAEIDGRRIERILRNLVSNAIEHGEGHPIEIRLGANEAAVAVSVRDHGVGLRPGEAALVFTRFWRADPARARTTGGTGLGLAISLEDARLHAGRLEAWGVLGEGSCFRLTLPRQTDGTITTSPLPLSPLIAEVRDAATEAADRAAAPGSGADSGPLSGPLRGPLAGPASGSSSRPPSGPGAGQVTGPVTGSVSGAAVGSERP